MEKQKIISSEGAQIDSGFRGEYSPIFLASPQDLKLVEASEITELPVQMFCCSPEDILELEELRYLPPGQLKTR